MLLEDLILFKSALLLKETPSLKDKKSTIKELAGV